MPKFEYPQGGTDYGGEIVFQAVPLSQILANWDLLLDHWDELTKREQQVALLLTFRFPHSFVNEQAKAYLDRQEEFVEIFGAYQEALKCRDPRAEEEYQERRAKFTAKWRHVDVISPRGQVKISEAWRGLRIPIKRHDQTLEDYARELHASQLGRYTQAEVADRLGITAGRVSQIVNQIEAKLGVEDELSRFVALIILEEQGDEDFVYRLRQGRDLTPEQQAEWEHVLAQFGPEEEEENAES